MISFSLSLGEFSIFSNKNFRKKKAFSSIFVHVFFALYLRIRKVSQISRFHVFFAFFFAHFWRIRLSFAKNWRNFANISQLCSLGNKDKFMFAHTISCRCTFILIYRVALLMIKGFIDLMNHYVNN